MRDRLRQAVQAGRFDEVEAIVSKEPKMVRQIVGLMYCLDEAVRKNCAEALTLASKHHPKLVKRVIVNLVWAMDQRSGTYAPTAPEMLRAIADKQPELLTPVMGELVRLAGDASLSDGLCDTLRVVSQSCPGELGQRLGKTLAKCVKHGDNFDINSRR
jgi:hypothetical protein